MSWLKLILFSLYGILYAGKKGESKFFEVILKNNLREFNRLLPEVNPNMRDSRGRTPLMIASALGRSHMVQRLIDRDHINTHAIDNFSRTALHYAAHSGDEETIRNLLKLLPNMNINTDQRGRTPLMYACSPFSKNSTSRILSLRTNNEDFFKYSSRKPLNQNIIPAVKLLLEAGADPNAADHNEKTPLMAAAKRNNYALCLFLLRAGANPSAVTLTQKTVLHKMVTPYQLISTRLFLLFIVAGTPSEKKDSNDQTAFDRAEMLGKDVLKTLKKSLSAEGEPRATYAAYLSKQVYLNRKLYCETFKGNLKTVQLLLRKKANPLAHFSPAAHPIENSIDLVNFLLVYKSFPHLLDSHERIIASFPPGAHASFVFDKLRKNSSILLSLVYLNSLCAQAHIALPHDISTMILSKIYPEYCDHILDYFRKIFSTLLKQGKIHSILPDVSLIDFTS